MLVSHGMTLAYTPNDRALEASGQNRHGKFHNLVAARRMSANRGEKPSYAIVRVALRFLARNLMI
jgi:hypothetical protein